MTRPSLLKMAMLTLVITLSTTGSIFAASLCSTHDSSLPDWKIHREMKFSFALLSRDGATSAIPENRAADRATAPEKPASLGLTPSWQADITNINLGALQSLGFVLPRHFRLATRKNLFIKLFEFPAILKPFKTVLPIYSGFALDRLSRGTELLNYMLKPENLAVKLCFVDKSTTSFTPEKPYPIIQLSHNSAQAQEDFSENVFFSSIYLQPASDPSCGVPGCPYSGEPLASGLSVLSFHAQLLTLYQNIFTEIPTSDPSNHFFALPIESGHGVLRILKIPSDPMVFDNWRDLPMPQEKGMYLTGLLLVKLVDYVETGSCAGTCFTSRLLVDPAMIPDLESEQFKSRFKAVRTHVLEVGSVTRNK